MEIPAQVAAWALAAIQAASEAGIDTYTRRRLSDAFTSVQVATAALPQARAQVAQISASPALVRDEKVRQARDIAKKANDAAAKALDELDAAREQVAKQLDDALRVKKPGSVDPVTLVDRKSEVKELLTARGGKDAEQLTRAMGKMLDEALDAGDGLKAFIVANQLDDWAEARGVTLSTWAQLRGQVIGAHAGNGKPIPGSRLWHILAEGGENTLAGYLAYVRAKVTWAAEELDKFIAEGSRFWQNGMGH